jgi:hypothetical protein
MKIKGPTSPLSSGAEPLEPLDLRKAVESERFASTLSQLEGQTASSTGANQSSSATNETRAALAEIASGANLSTSEGAASAVRESARYMIRSRLSERYRDTEPAQKLASQLSEYVAKDPLLNNKLLSILQRIQAE